MMGIVPSLSRSQFSINSKMAPERSGTISCRFQSLEHLSLRFLFVGKVGNSLSNLAIIIFCQCLKGLGHAILGNFV